MNKVNNKQLINWYACTINFGLENTINIGIDEDKVEGIKRGLTNESYGTLNKVLLERDIFVSWDKVNFIRIEWGGSRYENIAEDK
jgi:hypothetical protein